MTTIVERTAGHYEVKNETYGKNYVWCPGCVVVECECDERPVLSASQTTCRCGIDHGALISEELTSRPPSEVDSHPLNEECHNWRKKRDEYLRSEEHYQLELSTID